MVATYSDFKIILVKQILSFKMKISKKLKSSNNFTKTFFLIYKNKLLTTGIKSHINLIGRKFLKSFRNRKK